MWVLPVVDLGTREAVDIVRWGPALGTPICVAAKGILGVVTKYALDIMKSRSIPRKVLTEKYGLRKEAC